MISNKTDDLLAQTFISKERLEIQAYKEALRSEHKKDKPDQEIIDKCKNKIEKLEKLLYEN